MSTSEGYKDAWDRASKERPKPHVLEGHHQIPQSWVRHGADDTQQKITYISGTAHDNTHHLIDRFVRSGGPENVAKATLRTYSDAEREMALYAWENRPEKPTPTLLPNVPDAVTTLAYGVQTADKRLDRVPRFDPRSLSFRMEDALQEMGFSTKQVRSRKWSCDISLDQGSEGACVGNAWTHWAATTPKKWTRSDGQPFNEGDAVDLYHAAQNDDEFPGNNYEGSSTLGGARASQALGRVKQYFWAKTIEEITSSISNVGPVVFGINWYQPMFRPDPKTGLVTVTGSLAGGHDIIGDGVDATNERVRLHNSWGPRWGLNGYCWISFADLERLVIREQGDACLAFKNRVGTPGTGTFTA